ncbi:MAG: N,N-dimethylformamidase, partial [Gammaproteobacteria bacterium]
MNTQKSMLRIAGYSNRFSVRPEESISFHINAEEGEPFEAEIVRLIHGDTNPAGPGYKEEVIESDISGTHQGIHQALFAGSYVVVPHAEILNVESFSICAYIFPTTPTLDT